MPCLSRRLLALVLILCALLPFASPRAEAVDSAFPFTPRELEAIMSRHLAPNGFTAAMSQDADGVFLTVYRDGAVKAEVRFGPDGALQHDPDGSIAKIVVKFQNMTRADGGPDEAAAIMDAIVAACEPGWDGEMRSRPILRGFDAFELLGPVSRYDGEHYLFSFSRDWVFTVEPSRPDPSVYGLPAIDWADGVPVNGYVVKHSSDGVCDFFYVHRAGSPMGEPTFLIGPEDSYGSVPGKNVVFRFFREVGSNSASAEQAEAFCAYLRSQASFEGYAAAYSFPASSTSGSGTYIVFSDGWDLDAYSRDLQYLYDWSPWTNCDNVQLWIKPVDYGDRVASDWDRIWNQLGGSLALWIMPQMDWGGFTLALCFVDGEDGAVVRRYCPGADR